jgi:inosine/xanthosine triphosphate pyrophosphatase family protein
MKPIVFITGKKDKVREVSALLLAVQGSDMDLTEVQELDAQKIIAAKLAEAQKHQPGPFIVEDTLPLSRYHERPAWPTGFQPDGQSKTFAEMTPEEKSRFSMRKRAVEGLRQHLEQKQCVVSTERSYLRER